MAKNARNTTPLLSLAPLPRAQAAPRMVVGRLVATSASGEPRVDFAGNRSAGGVSARSTVPINLQDVGREVTLLFPEGVGGPVITGLIVEPLAQPSQQPRVELDGRTLTFTAEDQIVLRCGQASITLTADGKILIKGAHLLSRASGANRIRGGSVQIN